MSTALQSHLSDLLASPLTRLRPLSGGDIAAVYVAEGKQQAWLVKVQGGSQGLDMLTVERAGLEAIGATGAIRTPEVHHCGPWHGGGLLVMEYIPTRAARPEDLRRLGEQLAALHQCRAEDFGWDRDNFIGSLPQSNRIQPDWPTFYARERLWPQLTMARQALLLKPTEIPALAAIETLCRDELPDCRPGLLHGDLWSGNYLIAADGTPVLIDPAVYFGHGEVDLAMSRLFGGFGPGFYEAYEAITPTPPGGDRRNELYQLYYLLVHLNLFGRSYYPAVSRLLQHWA
ncbi:MAG: fructosamine kinase family protein [Lewinella sp.]|nr:fructosamine kinase family protein [Lewinella sp.]